MTTIVASCTHPQTRHVHGTHAAYTLDGCRCTDCSTAQRRYDKRRRHLIASNRWLLWADAEPVRAHVADLRSRGMGWERIADAAGIARSTMSRLIYGMPAADGPRVFADRCRTSTAAAVLAVEPSLTDAPPNAWWPIHGARRRVQALAALGWSTRLIGEATGLGRETIGGLSSPDRHIVIVRVALAVNDVYDRLSLQLPPAATVEQRVAATRVRNHARRMGWPPPLAWDDDALDDPDGTAAVAVTPVPVDDVAVDRRANGDRTVALNTAERVAVIRRLNAAGMSDHQIADRTGLIERSVARVRARHHIPAAHPYTRREVAAS